jgi:hypothetical protein
MARDVTLIPEAIGVGELAISDHRGSHPSTHELTRLVADVRVAGMLSGKAGKCYFHMGDHKVCARAQCVCVCVGGGGGVQCLSIVSCAQFKQKSHHLCRPALFHLILMS